MPRKEDKTREKLAADAANMREQAKLLPPGPVRDALLRKAREAETALRVGERLISSGLNQPE